MSTLADEFPILQDMCDFKEQYCKNDCENCAVSNECTGLLIETMMESLKLFTIGA